MASIAEINVRIGARIQDLTKNLGKAERQLKRSAQKMSQLGTQITTAVSLPIIGIGAAAIKSAGDMEQLENGLTSIMGDAKVAARELERLKEAAKNPGLGFTQAVKGSVRLQSVGISAETARKGLLNFGNAIALAGGTASDLDGVSLALTQIISKGKISAEEINQLAERVPQVRSAIKDAFGTSDSEELQKLGISSEEFVEKVIDEMGKLPKATGGIKNAITNAGIAIQIFLSDIGKEINTAFDVQGAIEGFSSWLMGVTENFKSLSASTKKTVLTMIALVASIGPAIKVYSFYKSIQAGLIALEAKRVLNLKKLISSNIDNGKSTDDLVKKLNEGGLLNALKKGKAAILGMASSFGKLSLVMKASVIGAVVAATVAAVAIFKKWNNTISDSQKAQQTLIDVQTKAAQSIVEEKIKVEGLTDILKNENKTREEKQQALKELNQISPKYFGGLDLEKIKIQDVNKAQKEYIANMLQMAKVQAAKERIVELNKELLDTEGILDKTEPGFDNFEAGLIRMTDFSGTRAEKLAKIWSESANDYKAGLQNQIDELVKFAAAEEAIQDKRVTTTTSEPKTFKRKEKAEKTKLAKVDIIDIGSINEQKAAQNSLFTSLVENLTTTEAFQRRLKEEQQLGKIAQDELLQSIATSPEHFEASRMALESLRIEMQETAKQEAQFKAMQEAAETAGAAIQSYAKQGGDSLKDLGKVALKAAADVVRAEMMKAVAAYISKTITTLGPLGIILAAAGSAVVGTLFNKAIGSLSVPALAEGGLATAPTLAMVGDNRNASVDPEVIAPLSKLKNMLGGMGGNNVNVTGSFRVAGQDLLLVLDNASRDRMRTAGY